MFVQFSSYGAQTVDMTSYTSIGDQVQQAKKSHLSQCVLSLTITVVPGMRFIARVFSVILAVACRACMASPISLCNATVYRVLPVYCCCVGGLGSLALSRSFPVPSFVFSSCLLCCQLGHSAMGFGLNESFSWMRVLLFYVRMSKI